MRIIINGRFLTQRKTGIQRYAFETLVALDELIVRSGMAERIEVVLVAPRGTTGPKLSAIRMVTVGPFRGHLWEQLILPSVCGRSFLVNFGPTGPLAKKHQVVTIHDAAVFFMAHTFGGAFRRFYRFLVPILARRAQCVVTVSEFSRGELSRVIGPKMSSARISGEGWQHVLRTAADEGVLDRNRLRGRRYVLAVGSITPHKNLAVVARAAEMLGTSLDVQIVVAGQVDRSVFGQVEIPVSPILRLLGYVTDAELRALYEHADAFVHPSLYEGFGIPPLEAMALGCPVIASDAAAIPEVCGSGAWYFSPHDATGLANLIRRLVTSEHERTQLIELGRAQALRHSWAASAETFLAILEEVSGIHLRSPRARAEPETSRARSSAASPLLVARGR